MIEDSEGLANALETLATEIESNTQEMAALREAIDDFRTSYEYAVRNSECPYIVEAKAAKNGEPETIACARCDVDSPASLAAALQEGWIDLCRDNGTGWNYLGICPCCKQAEAEHDRQVQAKAEVKKRKREQKALF